MPPERLDEAGSWVLRFAQRPFTINAERRMHHMERARHVREWRTKSASLAKVKGIPALTAVHIHAHPHLKGRLQDADACHPSVKAVIDGLVDAGVIPDDDPRYVRAVTYHAPTRAKADFLLVTVVDLGDEPR
jgi:crossover junction endodeoxyribonuclease RusA